MILDLMKMYMKLSEGISGMCEKQSGNITLPGGYTNHGDVRNYYTRRGHVCMVGIDCTPPTRVTADTLFTLPSSCRPIRALRFSVFSGVSRSADDGADQYLVINTDGTVQYTGKARLFNTFTFICSGGVINTLRWISASFFRREVAL